MRTARTARLKNTSAFAVAAPFILSGYYANTLTRMIPDLYQGLDIVSRGLVGMIPSVTRNVSAETAAVGQAIVIPKSTPRGTFNVQPAMSVPEPADAITEYDTIQITKSKGVEFGWTGEEQKGVNHGPGWVSIQAGYFAEALKTLTDEIEYDLWKEGAMHASRAYGTPGITPFATNLGDSAQMKKILDDNGAPNFGRSVVMDTTAGAALRTIGNLTKVNENGSSMTLRDGVLLDQHGFALKESAQVGQTVASTGASATTNNAGYAVGATVINLANAGTGNIQAGSFIQFAGDNNKYAVAVGDTDVSNGGSITLARPGLRRAIPAVATAITVVAQGTANLGFASTAIHLVARAPARPTQGDLAIDVTTITDVRSGMTYEVALYPGYRKIRAEVTQAWGVKALKEEHIGIMFG